MIPAPVWDFIDVIAYYLASWFILSCTPLIAMFELVHGYFRPAPRRPSPRCVVITGASSGIGTALALHYAGQGVHLALTGRNKAALDSIQSQCELRGSTVSSSSIDVKDSVALRAWMAGVDAQHPIDLCIANAGVSETMLGLGGDVEGSTRGVFDVNLTGAFNTLFPALDFMTARGQGQIALMSSLAGFGPLTGAAAYSASKAALRVFGIALRAQVARDGVSVVVVQPGFIESPMTAIQTHSMPFLMKMEDAVKAIVEGLARDLPVVAFPLPMSVGAQVMGSMHWVVREFLARYRLLPPVANMRPRRAGAGTPALTAGGSGARGREEAGLDVTEVASVSGGESRTRGRGRRASRS